MFNQDLFSEFPPISKAEWLRQITKDLKDKPLADLDWQLPNGLLVSPLVHAEDFEISPAPISEQPNAWEICEDISVDDVVLANRQALEALEGGAEGLCFHLNQPLNSIDFAQLFQNIHLDFIGLYFEGPAVAENPGSIFALLEGLAKQRGLSTTQLRGALAYDPVPVSKIVDWRYLADLLEYGREKFPEFKIIQISAPKLLSEGVSQEKSSGVLLRNANIYLEKLSERGIPVKDIVAVLEFKVLIGKSYFLEIARLRALKILWFNVLKGWNAPLQAPAIAAQFHPEDYSDDLYTNMIRATTMAMSAVQGGVSRLSVLPYDAGREGQSNYPQAFSRRIARNVQHLLKMESDLDEVMDPAAGSYYLETLTSQLAEKAWADFCEK